MMNGKMIIVSAPSGGGKTTIVKRLLKAGLGLEFSISACSRDKRPGEIDRKDYYFMSIDDFRDNIEAEQFLEWEEVYKDQYYGTLLTELNRIWEKGNHIIFDVDVIGGINIKNIYPDQSLALFIRPPSIEQLEERLRSRSTENEASLEKRISKAEHEMSFETEFDQTIINDDLETAIKETIAICRNFLQS